MSKEMTGEEVGKELGISRQAVCNSLKRSLGKIYSRLREDNPDLSPFEIASEMMKYFDIGSNQNEIQNFYNLLPPKVKNEIEESVKENGGGWKCIG